MKLPVTETEVIEKPNPPVLVTVMVCGLLEESTDCDENVSEVGESVAVVSSVPAVSRGICQRPRPYVPATRTGVEDVAGVAPRATTGEAGMPAPMGCQQLALTFEQVLIWRV